MATLYGPANERLNETSLVTSTKLLACPYEPSHRILANRFQTHLKKCAIQHAEKRGLVICDLNFTHHVPPEKLEEHMKTCADRHKIDSFLCTTGTNVQLKKIPVSTAPSHESEENWDDVNCPTYDALKANENNPLLLCLKGRSKSERRTFQKEQRIRNSRLLNGEVPSSSKK